MNPQRTISVTTTPSITVIQGAYESFCVPGEVVTESRIAINESGAELIVSLTSEIPFVTDPPVEDWLRFQCLVARWQQERGAMSSITEAALCPGYQSIIGMGMVAVPFLLAQLESEGDEPDQWFWALKAITGADPVRDEDRGNYIAMARSWLDWAKSEGDAW